MSLFDFFVGNMKTYFMPLCLLFSLFAHLLLIAGQRSVIVSGETAIVQTGVAVVAGSRTDFFREIMPEELIAEVRQQTEPRKVKPAEPSPVRPFVPPVVEQKNEVPGPVVRDVLVERPEVAQDPLEVEAVAEVDVTADLSEDGIAEAEEFVFAEVATVADDVGPVDVAAAAIVNNNASLSAIVAVESAASEGQQALPRYLNCPEPVYPLRAKSNGWSGTAKFDALVQVDGRVGDLELVESSGYGMLDRAAQKAIRGWLFHPAIRQGVKVASRVVIPLEFVLK